MGIFTKTNAWIIESARNSEDFKGLLIALYIIMGTLLSIPIAVTVGTLTKGIFGFITGLLLGLCVIYGAFAILAYIANHEHRY